MTDADRNFLETVKLDVLGRLSNLKKNAKLFAENPNPLVRLYTDHITDPAWRQFVYEHTSPTEVLKRVEEVELLIRIGDWSTAYTALLKLERNGRWVSDLYSRRPIMTGYKQINASETGKAMRKGRLKDQTSVVLAEMQALIAASRPGGRKMSVSAAAQLVAKKGLGMSGESNRRLWSRHRKKVGTHPGNVPT